MTAWRWIACLLVAAAALGRFALAAADPQAALDDPGLMRLDRAQVIEVQSGREFEPRSIGLPLHWDMAHRHSGRVDLIVPFRLPAGPRGSATPTRSS